MEYKVGDRVFYLDTNKECKLGTIAQVDKTNDGSKNLYLLSSYPYLRGEEEILGYFEALGGKNYEYIPERKRKSKKQSY